MNDSIRWFTKKKMVVGLGLFLSACAMGPEFTSPAAPDVKGYTITPMTAALSVSGDKQAQRLQMGHTVSSQWWELFHSSALTALVNLAIENNQNLAAAKATLAEARKSVLQAEGALYPQIDVNTSYERQRIGTTVAASNLYVVGANASYVPDIFGGSRREIEFQQALADNQFYQLGAAYLTLTGNIVTQSINLASLNAEIAAVDEIIVDDEKNLRLAEEKFEAGKSTQTDVMTAKSQLANDRTEIAPLRQQVSIAKHAIAILSGQFSGRWSPPVFDLGSLSLPRDLPVSLPSDLVRQRPDILAAEAQLHAASATIGIATAQMYPSITLSGSLGTQALNSSGLFSASSQMWNLAAGLTAPIFHGGALEMQKEAAIDAFRASFATYRQTILVAFGQVADTLRALKHDAELLDAQKQSLETAGIALNLQRLSYAAGKTDLFGLIDAERSYQQAKLGYVRAEGQRYQDTAQLFIVLGGGWWKSQNKVISISRP
ncbi:MAG: efflux transporter outer membrane subunit [Pseudomonadota bacterium]|nr:efflux transporter outer membrane subunit [Pseudomonadota bacterium]